MRHLVLILLLFPMLSILASNPTELYIEGNRAYENGEFDEAIHVYNSAIAQGGADARLYYNLGNSYFRAGMIGESVLAYERALTLAPRDEDIKYNLDFVRKTNVDIIINEDGTRIRSLYDDTPLGVFYDLLGMFTFTEFISACAVFTIIGTLMLFFGIVFRGRSRRIFRIISIICWSIASLIIIPYIFKRTHIWDTDKAIVVSQKAELRSAPSATSQLNYTLRPGHEVAVREVRGEYSRVFLRNGDDNWVLSDQIERVIPQK